MPDDLPDRIIATIRKNARESIRAALSPVERGNSRTTSRGRAVRLSDWLTQHTSSRTNGPGWWTSKPGLVRLQLSVHVERTSDALHTNAI